MVKKEFFGLVFTAILVMSTLSFVVIAVKAQNDATVTVLDSGGGTTSITGTNTYPDGTAVTISATPSSATSAFLNWIITTTAGSSNSFDNPLSITVESGTTYTIQAVFETVLPPPGRDIPSDLSSAAIVVVLAAAGGTSTPAPWLPPPGPTWAISPIWMARGAPRS